MILQKFLAFLDRFISELFQIQSSGTIFEEERSKWEYFFDFGPRIGIVGTDEKIHTVTGYWAIRHYYDGSRLLKRASTRKDLKDGERLATPDELLCWAKQIITTTAS